MVWALGYGGLKSDIGGGGGKSGQGQIGPLVHINVTFEMNIGIKVVMILL